MAAGTKNMSQEGLCKTPCSEKSTSVESVDVGSTDGFANKMTDPDETSPLCLKLKHAKKLQNLTAYCKVFVTELDKEASSLFKSIFFLLLYCIMFMNGIQHELVRGHHCKSDPLLAICLIQSGILGCLVNAINLVDFFCGVVSRYVDRCRKIFLFVLFINNCLGLFHLYSLWKPDVVNRDSEFFCQFSIFWVAFFTLHCACVLYVFVILFTIVCVFYYCI